MAVDRRAAGGDRAQPRHLRAAVDGRAARASLPAGADDDPGLDRALDRRARRRRGRNRGPVRDPPHLGLLRARRSPAQSRSSACGTSSRTSPTRSSPSSRSRSPARRSPSSRRRRSSARRSSASRSPRSCSSSTATAWPRTSATPRRAARAGSSASSTGSPVPLERRELRALPARRGRPAEAPLARAHARHARAAA